MSSTPSRDLSKKGSPKSSMVEPIYGNKAVCELNENSEALLGALNGSSDIFTNGLSAGDRISGDYDINTVLPPPKSRELAIGESYSDIGKVLSPLLSFIGNKGPYRLQIPFYSQVSPTVRAIRRTGRK